MQEGLYYNTGPQSQSDQGIRIQYREESIQRISLRLREPRGRTPRRQTTPTTANRAQDIVEAEVTTATKGKGKKASAQKVNAFLSQDIVEAEVTAAMEKKEKEGQTRKHIGARQSTPGQQQSGVGTGANTTPIILGKASRPGTLEETEELMEEKPGKVQCTPKGSKGPISIQVLMTGCPTIPASGDSWKRSFLAGFNAKRERLALEMPICATHVSFAFSYPSERVVMIHHPANTKYEEIIRAVARMRREMYNNYIQHPNESLVFILQEITELVATGLQGTRGEKAWDRAESICRDLKLTRAAWPPKWLVKGKGDGYEGKKCSLRFSVTTASLRAIKSPLPIPYNKDRIYLYQRVDDKAFYVDELKYIVVEPRPSHSPEPVWTWGACTYCHRVNYMVDTYWSRKNAQA
ncbi:hypothetical protein L211DRAFT_876442 [Terfezia boudieri ATCC MYA-4762]|uniref:Uncharacterized protein n=1 Tax=Terfezia boudieri ATCC MYA-4762 TaxID=1051890 RepID=A0A3N4L5X5_9PEZI|nr:hypothetical protein L211DRAFT_876442 [Terfezia boudieri ATCC MYA-4762]